MVLSFLVAVTPAIAYTLIIWWVDRFEREPVQLILAMFGWGALPAVILAIVLELSVDESLRSLASSPAQLLVPIASGLTAPVVEELLKGAALLALALFLRGEFDDVLDGVVYGAVVGLGFAMSENFLYFVDTLSGEGANWAAIVVLRSVFFGLNHAFYTAITGAGLGLAITLRRGPPRWLLPLFGLALAMAFHVVHNWAVTLSETALLAFVVALVTDWGGVAVLVVIIVLALHQERRWIASELWPEVGYTLTPAEYVTACSYGRRWRVWLQGLWQGGWRRARAASRYHHLLAELAFLKRRLRLKGDSPELRNRIAVQRERIQALRRAADLAEGGD